MMLWDVVMVMCVMDVCGMVLSDDDVVFVYCDVCVCDVLVLCGDGVMLCVCVDVMWDVCWCVCDVGCVMMMLMV